MTINQASNYLKGNKIDKFKNVDYIINEMNAIFTKNQTVKKENIVEDFIEDKEDSRDYKQLEDGLDSLMKRKFTGL